MVTEVMGRDIRRERTAPPVERGGENALTPRRLLTQRMARAPRFAIAQARCATNCHLITPHTSRLSHHAEFGLSLHLESESTTSAISRSIMIKINNDYAKGGSVVS